jgi:hypothetical protein
MSSFTKFLGMNLSNIWVEYSLSYTIDTEPNIKNGIIWSHPYSSFFIHPTKHNDESSSHGAHVIVSGGFKQLRWAHADKIVLSRSFPPKLDTTAPRWGEEREYASKGCARAITLFLRQYACSTGGTTVPSYRGFWGCALRWEHWRQPLKTWLHAIVFL